MEKKGKQMGMRRKRIRTVRTWSSSEMIRNRMTMIRCGGGGGGGVRMKVKKLQRLIPGGRELNPETLILRTADYIFHLKRQLNLLQFLNNLIIIHNHNNIN